MWRSPPHLRPKPQVLIADEPTTALDAQMQSGVLDLLGRLRDERQLTLVLITHDLALAAQRADHLVVFRDGRVVETGVAMTSSGTANRVYARTACRPRRHRRTARPAIGKTVVGRTSGEAFRRHSPTRGRRRFIRVHAGEILGLVGASVPASPRSRCLVHLERLIPAMCGMRTARAA